MTLRRPALPFLSLAACALAGLVAATPARATDIALAAGAGWSEFTVDSFVAPSFGTGWIDIADGSALRFAFTVPTGATATLTVVDAGFAGDTFTVTDFGSRVGTTSSVPVGTASGTPVFDFDTAFGSAAFSRGTFSFGAGQHLVGGALAQSVRDASGAALDATNGAVRLAIAAPVPEPSSVLLLAGGLAALAVRRRRAARAR